jgi:hypothetical protein
MYKNLLLGRLAFLLFIERVGNADLYSTDGAITINIPSSLVKSWP